MEILLNPNVVYLLLVFGLSLAALALFNPGTGILEVFALLILILAGYLITQLSFNPWALAMLLVGLLFFLLAVLYPRRLIFLILAIIALVIGSAFLFPSEVWWIPSVNPLLALFMSGFMAVFFWYVGHKVIEARLAPPKVGPDTVMGAIGEAATDIADEGTVQVASELWSARSAAPIPKGSRVRVISRQGFTLNVERIENENSQEVNP
jgi:membrane-bound serine protease (ClpP class)